MKTRKIHKMTKSKPTLEGARVHRHRAFGGSSDARTFDPFLFLDDFYQDRSRMTTGDMRKRWRGFM